MKKATFKNVRLLDQTFAFERGFLFVADYQGNTTLAIRVDDIVGIFQASCARSERERAYNAVDALELVFCLRYGAGHTVPYLTTEITQWIFTNLNTPFFNGTVL